MIAFLAIFVGLSGRNLNAAESADQPTIQQIRSARDEGQFTSAAEMLMRFDETAQADLSLEFVLLVHEAKGHFSDDVIDELLTRAVDSLARSELKPESLSQRLLICTFAATHFINQNNFQIASAILTKALAESVSVGTDAPDQRGRQLIQLAMKTAWSELNTGQLKNAETIYGLILDLATKDGWRDAVGADRELAMLGLAWATAMQPDRTDEAVKRLYKFTDTFPTHSDAPRAAAMLIHCLEKLGRKNERDDAVVNFLKRWPAHPLADQVVLQTLNLPSSESQSADSSELAATLQNWIVADGDPREWTTTLVRRALLFAGEKLPPPRFDSLLRRLAAEDQTGQQTSVLLHESVESGRSAIAEQIAATLISGDLAEASGMSREAACRWAGRTGRWSMLSLAAESTDLSVPDDRRTAHVDRLFAEALTQTGQNEKAAKWWAHLVDHRGASDFATLLRCAEAAVARADIAEATRRLDRAVRSLEETDSPDVAPQQQTVRTALVDLLAGELAVRKADFSAARSHYENVVRSPASTPALRGRAQWMIGETHFMQHQFEGAIDDYRKVEGLDPGGPFVAAALVQAGKSFEQLGLTREAGDCYSALLGRFADSSYAVEARHRMASLPNSGTGNVNSRQGSGAKDASPDSSRLRR
ncbi:MAG: tetratricopeptide repeat protein [Planctomycetales bacterium]|nr:tetratricopeptide repeat protein [Planctomycetales bacterium]